MAPETTELYAILDIETTGGQFNEEGITEIAIYRFDGHEVTDQFISLVNPEIPIQPFVVKLTGISNAMLRSAPKFHEVAKRIVEITQDAILVAHNAPFDYRILRTEFRRLGYDFQSKTLCTVELAQKLLPEQPSYSLGKLVRSLGIPMADRHRATGDAIATVKLFKLLLDRDSNKEIVREFIRTEVEKGLEPRLLDIVESLPSRTGIYYIHREDGTVTFIGRSRNIRKSVNQHFASDARISKILRSEVFRVTYDDTGSEMIALLKEHEQIRALTPAHNRIPKKRNYQWMLTIQTDEQGFITLGYRRAEKNDPACFLSRHDAHANLVRIAQQYKLCPARCGILEPGAACPDNTPCGACTGAEDAAGYNKRVNEFLLRSVPETDSFIAVGRGRTINERSAVVVENGRYLGYSFFDLNFQINNKNILKNLLIPHQPEGNASAIIRSFLIRNKAIKIIPFE